MFINFPNLKNLILLEKQYTQPNFYTKIVHGSFFISLQVQ